MIPFQTTELSDKFVIYKRLLHAIDIHHKEMESVFIIIKYYNIGITNININWCYTKLIRTINFISDYVI